MPLPKGKTMEELGIKPGDKLRFCENYAGYKTGDVVTVIGGHEECLDIVIVKDNDGKSLGSLLWRLERDQPEPETLPSKFKVGDKCRVTGGDNHLYDVGTIVKVAEVSADDGLIQCISIGEKPLFQAILPEDLKLITPDKPARKPKVGDRVRVTKYFGGFGERNTDREGVGIVKNTHENSFYAELDSGIEVCILTSASKDEWEFIDESAQPLENHHLQAPSMIIDIDDLDPSAQKAAKRLHEAFSHPPRYLSAESHKTITTRKGGTIVQKLTLLAKKAFDKDTKTLIKAGVLDSDLHVQDSQFVLSFLVDQHKAELAKIAQAVLDEEKADK